MLNMLETLAIVRGNVGFFHDGMDNVSLVINLLLLVPATVSSAERSFSSLHFIKPALFLLRGWSLGQS